MQSHFTDSITEQGHSFPLSPGLIPLVYFQNVEKVFLGKPFTQCIKTSATNNYTHWVSHIMSQSMSHNVLCSIHCAMLME